MPRLPSVEHRMLTGGLALTTVFGAQPGPTLALLGGVHGDEEEGVLAVQQVVRETERLPLTGTLRALAIASPAAWAAQSRFNPLDGGNLARSFQTAVDQGPTVAAAACITDDVIAGSDALIDLHSAGVRYRMPLMCGFCQEAAAPEKSRRLAQAFGAPVIWRHPGSAPGRSLSAADAHGIPAVYAECSGGGSIRAHELDAYVAGTMNVMAELGMLASDRRPCCDAPRWVSGDGNLDDGAHARNDGLFVSSVRAGDIVVAGEEIGRFYDHSGAALHTVDAPSSGMVMFLRRQARTQKSDVLFVLAQVEDDREKLA